MESKQDKTIVEHVHVLKEAKHVTDRQLTDAQMELQKNAAYIHSQCSKIFLVCKSVQLRSEHLVINS